MTLRIAGKQMDIGDAFRVRIEERIGEAIDKYFDGGFAGNVTVEKVGSRYGADCRLHLHSGAVLQATGEAHDPQAAFEAAADRIEKRLRRYKRRLKAHPLGNNEEAHDIAYRVMEPLDEEGEEEMPEGFSPAVVAESTLQMRTMSVASAVIQLDLTDSPVYVFRNSKGNGVNIVYRRADGNIGWIDPSSVNGA